MDEKRMRRRRIGLPIGLEKLALQYEEGVVLVRSGGSSILAAHLGGAGDGVNGA